MDSYVSVRAPPGVLAGELLQAVADRMGVPQQELLLVAVTCPGGTRPSCSCSGGCQTVSVSSRSSPPAARGQGLPVLGGPAARLQEVPGWRPGRNRQLRASLPPGVCLSVPTRVPAQDSLSGCELQRTSHLLPLNTWEVSAALSSLDWSLFHSVHEVSEGPSSPRTSFDSSCVLWSTVIT